jgi:hypothetical protein
VEDVQTVQATLRSIKAQQQKIIEALHHDQLALEEELSLSLYFHCMTYTD